MSRPPPISVRDFLLTRRGLAFVSPSGAAPPGKLVRAVELELAGVGYAVSTRLQAALARCAPADLAGFRKRTVDALAAHVGGGRRHEPLFRRFPDGVPDDTEDLWWKKVLSHFLQAEGQPCLFCRRTGTTHVLNPCRHVVCDRCFDGANYSACPVCEHHVDRTSPFFLPARERGPGRETAPFRLLDLGSSLEDEARQLFTSLAERRQALSPDDREALAAVVREFRLGVLPWLPAAIPVRENVAMVFGTLLQGLDPNAVLPHARRFLATATDVLRLVAVLSGTDGSLQKEVVFKKAQRLEGPNPFWSAIAKALRAKVPGPAWKEAIVPVRVNRFKVARLSRPLRRALLALLEGMDAERLTEDMLRHRSFWVWVGEFLHPGEFASRFPKVAKAFLSVRKNAPGGTPAPPFRGWASRLERAVREGDSAGMVAVLSERPGELARRFDHALRVAGGAPAAVERVVAAFESRVSAFANPVLLTLRSHLPGRVRPAPVRVYWPKGRVAKGVSAPDARASLSPEAVARALRPLERELLRRFGSKPAFADCVIDEGLRAVIVPFNERTASPSAVSLPRGSRIPVPIGKRVRLFLHWCEPQGGHGETDLDLSVAFYDAAWKYLGVCSYYELKCVRGGEEIAASSGDLRDAPWPDGASEFVDVRLEPALAAGVRYAVMVATKYGGLPFSLLERGFAGLMLRDDPAGPHFDPRTVELKFALQGESGVFLPLVLDLQESELHWLDVHSKGEFEMNNVEKSRDAIAKVCPDLMQYFASGTRASMFDLGLLHAAARCRRVFVRGAGVTRFERKENEESAAFLARLAAGGPGGEPAGLPGPNGAPLLALLFRGDLERPAGSSVYALFRDRTLPTLSAGDLLS